MFVEIDPATFNIARRLIEAAITPQTRAIVVVHLFGQMAAMEQTDADCPPPRASGNRRRRLRRSGPAA